VSVYERKTAESTVVVALCLLFDAREVVSGSQRNLIIPIQEILEFPAAVTIHILTDMTSWALAYCQTRQSPCKAQFHTTNMKTCKNTQDTVDKQLTLTVWRFITAIWTFYSAVAVNTASQAQTHSTSEVVRWTISCIYMTT